MQFSTGNFDPIRSSPYRSAHLFQDTGMFNVALHAVGSYAVDADRASPNRRGGQEVGG